MSKVFHGRPLFTVTIFRILFINPCKFYWCVCVCVWAGWGMGGLWGGNKRSVVKWWNAWALHTFGTSWDPEFCSDALMIGERKVLLWHLTQGNVALLYSYVHSWNKKHRFVCVYDKHCHCSLGLWHLSWRDVTPQTTSWMETTLAVASCHLSLTVLNCKKTPSLWQLKTSDS